MKEDKNNVNKQKSTLSDPGCVYLVGAGPGDPGLITVRGRQLLSEADVIIYDYLVSPRLLQEIRPEAELINAGKMGDLQSFPQVRINKLLIEKARQYRKVVRLKGGDPFVFGRGGEEALALAKAGIKFEVVPGITAGMAAAAYTGIPITHRGYANDLALISGHEDPDRTGPSRIDWPALGKWKGTLIFYMGEKNLPVICTNLQQHGMPADTPAALITWGATPQQQTLIGTIGTLPELAVKRSFTFPAIIIIGKVVTLRDQLNWFEK